VDPDVLLAALIEAVAENLPNGEAGVFQLAPNQDVAID
jgi:predicted RNA binding protein YcfA (HicA-like mRNA interferase family)